ncbi:MAG: flagellar biosynthesis repressor FlbT [Rhodospirillaceae bacterium]|nr:flagellar biosynthesis repressor FlbT [Rhodospirillaceae bacterium]
MALKIALKPNEKIVVNGAVIANGDKPARLHFLNNASFLREKDIMQEDDAKRDEDFIYYLVQLMYLDEGDAPRYRMQLDYAINALSEVHPDKAGALQEILSMVDGGHVYEALKECKKVFPDGA